MSRKDKRRNQLGTSPPASPPSPFIAQYQIQASGFSGPLPPPEILDKYNQVLPGAAERILTMAENQGRHRQNLEQKVVDSNCKAQDRAPIFGFIVVVIVVLGGIYLIHEGKNVEGLVAILGALGGLVSVFFYGKWEQKRDLTAKAQQFMQKPPH